MGKELARSSFGLLEPRSRDDRSCGRAPGGLVVVLPAWRSGEVSPRCDLAALLAPAWLDDIRRWAGEVEPLRDEHAPEKPIWVGYGLSASLVLAAQQGPAGGELGCADSGTEQEHPGAGAAGGRRHEDSDPERQE